GALARGLSRPSQNGEGRTAREIYIPDTQLWAVDRVETLRCAVLAALAPVHLAVGSGVPGFELGRLADVLDPRRDRLSAGGDTHLVRDAGHTSSSGCPEMARGRATLAAPRPFPARDIRRGRPGGSDGGLLLCRVAAVLGRARRFTLGGIPPARAPGADDP